MPEFRRPPTEKAWLPPKVFSGPNAVSVLDISLFNLSWPDIFFFFLKQECVNSFRNVCMRGQLHIHYWDFSITSL